MACNEVHMFWQLINVIKRNYLFVEQTKMKTSQKCMLGKKGKCPRTDTFGNWDGYTKLASNSTGYNKFFFNKTGVVWVLLCHIRSCAATTLTDIALIEMRRTYAKDSAPIRLLKLLKMWNLFCLFIPIKGVLQTHSLFQTENTLKICSGTQRIPHSVFMYALAKINYFNWKVLPGGKWLVVCVYFVGAWFRMHGVHFRKFLKCVFMYHLTGVWIMIGWFNAPSKEHTHIPYGYSELLDWLRHFTW